MRIDTTSEYRRRGTVLRRGAAPFAEGGGKLGSIIKECGPYPGGLSLVPNLIPMKALFHALCLAATAIGPAALSSAETPLAPVQAQPALTSLQANALTGTYLDQVEALVERGVSPVATLKHLKSHLGAAPMSKALRQDMLASIGYMLERSSTSHLTLLDSNMLRLELVDAQVQEAMAHFQVQAALRQWTPKQLYTSVMDWALNTSVFEDAPNAFGYRMHVAAALELSMLQSTGTTAMSTNLSIEMLRQRLYTAIRRLGESRERGDITQADYDRMREIAIGRCRMIILEKF